MVKTFWNWNVKGMSQFIKMFLEPFASGGTRQALKDSGNE